MRDVVRHVKLDDFVRVRGNREEGEGAQRKKQKKAEEDESPRFYFLMPRLT